MKANLQIPQRPKRAGPRPACRVAPGQAMSAAPWAVVVRGEGNGEVGAHVRRVEEFLKTRGVSVVHWRGEADVREGVGLVLSMGGDGTYLRAVHLLERLNFSVPVLGVHLGALGFLAHVTRRRTEEFLQKALDGSLKVQKRLMLRVTVQDSKGDGPRSTFALNDAVIERGAGAKLIRLNVHFGTKGDQSEAGFRADAVVVATPTGSTAYSLAAGGPVVLPQMESFVLTPVCAHTLTNRPIIMPSSYELEFELLTPARITVDGRAFGTYGAGYRVKVQRSPYEHLALLDPEGYNFFSVLRHKLKFGQ